MVDRAGVVMGAIVLALGLNGCVISETEKGPGPGDQKKEEAPPSSREAAPASPTNR